MADLFSRAFGVGMPKEMRMEMANSYQNTISSFSQDTMNTFNTFQAYNNENVDFGTAEQLAAVSARINGVLDDKVVSSCNNVCDLQLANRATSRWLLATQALATPHRLGQIEAWGCEYNPIENELLNNRILSGTGGVSNKDDYKIRWYADNRQLKDLNELSRYDRLTIIRNRNLALESLGDGVDPSSIFGGCF